MLQSTISKINPDRYADTSFTVKDTPPEVNAMPFAAIMRKTPAKRLLMGFDMSATARAMVWSSTPRRTAGGRTPPRLLPAILRRTAAVVRSQ